MGHLKVSRLEDSLLGEVCQVLQNKNKRRGGDYFDIGRLTMLVRGVVRPSNHSEVLNNSNKCGN